MKTGLLIFALFLAPALALAASSNEVVVKVISQMENQPTSYGSGWLVQRADGAYVVTSEHVLKPSGVQQILLGKEIIPCELVASDWGRGLALLKPLRKIVAGSSIESVDFENLNVGQTVTVLGFPFSQDEESLQSPGEIVLLKSTRAFLPLTTGIELIKSHGEFGMSGGPVFRSGSLKTSDFVGILSHQVLKVTPGEPSTIQALQSGAVAQNLFLIPRETVLQFIEQSLVPGARVKIERLSSSNNLLKLRVGSFVFAEKQVTGPRVQVAAPSTKGGDGWGTGGGQASTSGLQMEVSLIAGAAQELSFNSSPKLRDRLLQRKSTIISGFFSRDRETRRIQQYRFQTPEEFARLLVQPNLFPILGESGNDDGKTLAAVKAAKDIIAKFEAAGFKEDRLLSEVKLLLSLAETENRLLLERADVTRLLDASGPGKDSWRLLYGKDFDNSLALMNQLTELSNLL